MCDFKYIDNKTNFLYNLFRRQVMVDGPCLSQIICCLLVINYYIKVNKFIEYIILKVGFVCTERSTVVYASYKIPFVIY